MDINELRNIVNLNLNFDVLKNDEKKHLEELIYKTIPKEEKIWKPDFDEEYFFINDKVLCQKETWDGIYLNDTSEETIDKNRYNIGNCFKTKEKCESIIEKLKIRAELKRFAEQHNDIIEWCDTSIPKYEITYDHNTGQLFVMSEYDLKRMHGIYFSSDFIAQLAIETIGEERIKNYLFN